MELDLQRLGGALCALAHVARRRDSLGFHRTATRERLGHGLLEQLQPFPLSSGGEERQPVMLPARPRQAGDEPALHRIALDAITMGIVVVASLAACGCRRRPSR